MYKLDTNEIWESIRLEKKINGIVEEIYRDYNLTNPEGLKMAFRQAIWQGMCEGKGWLDD